MKRLLLTILLVLVAASPALAAEGHIYTNDWGIDQYQQSVYPKAPARVQKIATDTTIWLEKTLKVPLERRTVVIRSDPMYGDAQVVFTSAAIEVSQNTAVIWQHFLIPKGDNFVMADYVRLLIHEILHDRDLMDRHDLDIEEGVVDAVAYDLVSAWSKRFNGYGHDDLYDYSIGYPREVAYVRRLSRWATGSDHWRDRDARIWRRALLIADEPTRLSMVTAAYAAR